MDVIDLTMSEQQYQELIAECRAELQVLHNESLVLRVQRRINARKKRLCREKLEMIRLRRNAGDMTRFVREEPDEDVRSMTEHVLSDAAKVLQRFRANYQLRDELKTACTKAL